MVCTVLMLSGPKELEFSVSSIGHTGSAEADLVLHRDLKGPG